MTNVKNVMVKLLKKLIFSLFLATLLLCVLFQKTRAQIVGMEQGSTSQLIKNLQNQVDLQKTQLDTIKTTLGTLESKIKEQEESMTKIDAQKEFKKQLEENKQELKNAWVSYLAVEPEVTQDEEIVDKFSQAKNATEKHEQEFISKLEVKKETPKETVQTEPATEIVKKEEPKTEEIKTEEVKPEAAAEVKQTNAVEIKPEEKIEEKVVPELIQPAQEQPKPSEEAPAIVPQPETSPEVQTISKQIVPQETPQEPALVKPNELPIEINPPVPAKKETLPSKPETLPTGKRLESVEQTSIG